MFLALAAVFAQHDVREGGDIAVLVALIVISTIVVVTVRRWSHDLRTMGLTYSEAPTRVSWRGVCGNTASVILAGGFAVASYRQTHDRWVEFAIAVVIAVSSFFVIGSVPYARTFKPRSSEMLKLQIQQLSILAFTAIVIAIELGTLLEHAGAEAPARGPWMPEPHELAIGLYFAFVPILAVSTYRVRRRYLASRKSWAR